MAKVLLDIGARGIVFVEYFRLSNLGHSYTFLCGNKRFKGGWNGSYSQGRIRKIYSNYNAFCVPDASLDVVTLNDCNSIEFADGLQDELIRTLKPGGLFFSAHRFGLHPKFSSDALVSMHFRVPCRGQAYSIVSCRQFERVENELWKWVIPIILSGNWKIVYPPSPIIREQLVKLRIEQLVACMSSKEDHVPQLDMVPSFKIWRRK